MKKMTLSKTWTECLRMWKWVSVQKGSVRNLKRKWMRENGYKGIVANCFFCHYSTCSSCPGKLVDRSFSCCHEKYAYDKHPKKFYKKLLSLKRKRDKALKQRREKKC